MAVRTLYVSESLRGACIRQHLGLVLTATRESQTVLTLLEAGHLRLRETVVKRITANGVSIGSAVFAELTHVPNTYTDTNHATCDMCSNRTHLCIMYRRCGLKILFRLSILFAYFKGCVLHSCSSIVFPGFKQKLASQLKNQLKQGVALTGRNTTGPPSCATLASYVAYASVTDDDKRHTTIDAGDR